MRLFYCCFAGIKKRDPFAEPICSFDCWQLDYLRRAANFVKEWHAKAPTMSLTPQTTLANELTFVGMANLATHLLKNKGMNKVLLGKFSSNPIEVFWPILTAEQCKFLYICQATVGCWEVDLNSVSHTRWQAWVYWRGQTG